MSLDGKISTGSSDKRDVDKDFSRIKGVKEGLKQYYDLERKTDLFSMNSGKVMAKIGINEKAIIKNEFVNFVIVDSNHLTKKGVENLSRNVKKLFLVTSNKKHPAFKVSDVEVIYFPKKIDFKGLFRKLERDYGVKKLTVQTGGTLNSVLIRQGLVDRISVVVAPCVIGGKETSTLVDGESIVSGSDLKLIKSLKLVSVKKLKNSYLNLIYEVNDGS
jgi:2,5-diamino-6-(ribosylamino)-4(3H)-pyrimidinone 5'-phosphate reductase